MRYICTDVEQVLDELRKKLHEREEYFQRVSCITRSRRSIGRVEGLREAIKSLEEVADNWKSEDWNED